MILTYAKSKTKALCPCGAQSPSKPDGDWGAWKRSPEGREWFSEHTPHGRTQAVVAGGKSESLDEAIARKRKLRSETVPPEVTPFDR